MSIFNINKTLLPIPIFKIHKLKLSFLVSILLLSCTTKYTHGIQLLSKSEAESSLNHTNVTLQKCPWSNISQAYLKLEANFLLESNSSSSDGIFIFKLTNAKPDCSTESLYNFKVLFGKNNTSDHSDSLLTETLSNVTELDFDEFLGNISIGNETLWITPEQLALEDDIPEEEHSFSITHSGILSANFGKLKHIYREIRDYCIEEVSSSQVVLSFCHNICDERPCIPKCCPLNEVINVQETEPGNSYTCQNSGPLRWKPKLHNDADSAYPLSEIEHSEIKPHIYYHNRTNDYSCTPKFYYLHTGVKNEIMDEGHEFSNFRILRNGSLYVVEEDGLNYLIPQKEFCIDGIQNFGKESTYSGNHLKDLIFIECQEGEIPQPEDFEEREVREEQAKLRDFIVYLIVIPFSSLFLVLTIIVYILVWDLHNIHGHILFSYVCSLLGFYICLFLSQFFYLNTTACKLNGAGIHFFFLMTACWLTIINIDIFWTFKKLKVGGASQNLRKYLGYTSFAVGIPFLIVGISFILNEIYEGRHDAPIIIPEYGIRVCALAREAIGYYLYTPIGLLLCCNIVLFIWTVTTLLQYQRSIGAALRGTSSNEEDQSYGKISDLKLYRFTRFRFTKGCQRLGFNEWVPIIGLRVFLKIFVVTGCTWIFEIIGWAILYKTDDHLGASVPIRIIDVCNLLLPIPIFFIFVWKQNIYERLWKKYPCLRRILSICILGECCKTPPDDKHRPSFSAMTMSTLGRNGTLTTRIASNGSINELIAERQRKLSSRMNSTDSASEFVTERQMKLSSRMNSTDSASELVTERQRKLSRSYSNESTSELTGNRPRILSSTSRSSSFGGNQRNSGIFTVMESEEEYLDENCDQVKSSSPDILL